MVVSRDHIKQWLCHAHAVRKGADVEVGGEHGSAVMFESSPHTTKPRAGEALSKMSTRRWCQVLRPAQPQFLPSFQGSPRKKGPTRICRIC